jgi:6-phosphogluconolactonase
MGPDGHTASLFPDVPLKDLDEGPFHDYWVKSFFVPHLKENQPVRVSFTPKLINASENVVFLVTGRDKARAFDRVLHSTDSPYLTPARLIQPQNGNLFWVVDQEVSSREKLAS